MRRDSYRFHSTDSYRNGGSFTEPANPKTQVEVIRDVMLSASDCDTWLTLHEIAELTRFGEASISAQLRHLRKATFGGYRVQKRRRFGAGEIMALRERRMSPARSVGYASTTSSRSSSSARAKNRVTRASWMRAYGLKPGGWEYRVAR
jgi:hypothetical protein